ncbi:Signal transduction histidine kinase [Oceanospirillum multiglobuliferum]|uniref:histidine kinase n=1 Tax=Oceanospirillum multiglobuliferum TaxID=64969 RepID=A0A1T4RUI6_9GAMM|nr:ATP-binding protein [Oceanospirillum multiglobuliferum]OPX54622.1 hypothetical protein BTE48_13170 [Oceanospirillum multiglobuliferum]SKA19635.1 Signal transduction histidine kinase [Oceanospirillum multiglobuliferum]
MSSQTEHPVSGLSNRKQFIIAVGVFIFLSVVLIEIETFETVYEFSRTHEDWELDELIMAALSALITSAFTFAFNAYYQAQALKKEMTYRLKLERELAHAQKIQSLGTLAGGVAHSANNYLQPIMTLSRLAQKQLPSDSPLQPFMEKILLAANNAHNVLGELLRFSRQEPLAETEVYDLQKELDQHQLLYRAALSMQSKLSFDLTDQPCPVALSSSQIADITLALITNAEDSYNSQGGVIQVRLEQKGKMALLSVTDQGSGIAAHQIERLFEPFYTTKAVGEGTGLGLSIVHGLVQGVGGHVEVSSELDKGTTFSLHIPLAL